MRLHHLATALGVVGDAHTGTLVQHRSRVRRDPNQQNLRQVHLLHAELFAEAARRGHQIGPGDLGENITTRGVPLLDRLDGSRIVRKAGVVGVVERGGDVRPGQSIELALPDLPYAALEPV